MKQTSIYCVTFYEEGTNVALWSSGYYLTKEQALSEVQKTHPSTTINDVEESVLFTEQ